MVANMSTANLPPYNEFDEAPAYAEANQDSDDDSDSEILTGDAQLDRKFSDSKNGTIYTINRTSLLTNRFEISYAENNEKMYICQPRKTFALGGMILLDASDERPLCQTKREGIFALSFDLNYLGKSAFNHPENILVKRSHTVRGCYVFEWEGKIRLTWRHKSFFELRCRLQKIPPEASTSTGTNNVASSSTATKKQDPSERAYVAFFKHHALGPAQLRIVESMFDGLVNDKQSLYHTLILTAIYIRVLLQTKHAS
ncbi:hypothetical protein K493DRAFT_342631 [Basidiobolus meristosporus CBS 931.73]|uniref:Uncharacterized protein n=1 Tax=Basidiobolus meristosporus CBS 931.73 TaxID=1314790 RepID=A0A1Y1X2C4_9FUNG|nr:hypothetical protein K493DRAFT_342631 [Basidiobolus meristosporus CBS 931.73]|eukprot:ORX79951.1 hypothetical protein K493DRAFT_342631 [Basidiobolus meristosporus CBS 931.73]